MRGPAMLAAVTLAVALGLGGLAQAQELDETGTKPIKTFEDILEEQKAKKRDKGRLGLHFGLLGPSSLLDLQVSYGAHEVIDVLLSIGFTAGGEERVGNTIVGGPADYSAFTAALRGRLVPWAWPKGSATHGPTFELGFGMTGFSFNGSGEDNVKNTYTYGTGGSLPAILAGVGYTFRTKAGLRVNASAGWTQYFGTLKLPKVDAGSDMHPDDVAAIQALLDEEALKVDDSWPYVEFAIGWVF